MRHTSFGLPPDPSSIPFVPPTSTSWDVTSQQDFWLRSRIPGRTASHRKWSLMAVILCGWSSNGCTFSPSISHSSTPAKCANLTPDIPHITLTRSLAGSCDQSEASPMGRSRRRSCGYLGKLELAEAGPHTHSSTIDPALTYRYPALIRPGCSPFVPGSFSAASVPVQDTSTLQSTGGVDPFETDLGIVAPTPPKQGQTLQPHGNSLYIKLAHL